MKVLFLTIGNRSVASSRVRVYSYRPFLHKRGCKAFILPYTSSWQCAKILSMKKQNLFEKSLNKLYSTMVILFLFIAAPFFDVIYIQKVLLSKFSITVLKALNRNIIFDFDDAVFVHKNTAHLLNNSKCIIVANKFLKEFASGYDRKIYELPSPVEINNYPHLKRNAFVTLGWIGSPQTSKYLKPLIFVFKSLKDKFANLNFEFMGAENNKYFESLEIKISGWSIEGEREYLQRIDIGIMPLTDDECSRAKAGYKLLQYMAAAIPCVATPVGINKEIVEDGRNGFLASTAGEWMEKLSLLIKDASLRQRLGQEGLKSAERLYSYRVTTPRLMQILSFAANGGNSCAE